MLFQQPDVKLLIQESKTSVSSKQNLINGRTKFEKSFLTAQTIKSNTRCIHFVRHPSSRFWAPTGQAASLFVKRFQFTTEKKKAQQ